MKILILFFLFYISLFSSTIELSNEEKEFIKNHPKIKFSDVIWEPFASIDGDNYKGIFREYYNLIEQKTGLKFEFIKIGDGINFESVLNALKNKKIDMIDGSGKTIDRGKYAIFAGPFMQVNLVIASNFSKPVYNLTDNTNDLIIAVAKGSTAYEYLKEKSYAFKQLIITNGVDEAMDLVNQKKVDAMIENIVVVDYLKRKKKLSDIDISTISDYEFKIYSIIRDDYVLLASIISKAINHISKDEILQINSLLIQKTIESKKQIELNDIQKEYIKNKKYISMCVDPSWEPLEKINEIGEHEGIGADLIRLIASRLNLNIHLIQTKSWQESIELSKSGKCDILSLINQTQSRDKWLDYTDTLVENPTVIIANIDYPIITDLKHITGTIAIPKEYALLEKIEKDFPNLQIVTTNNEEESLNLISQKKVDLSINTLITSAYLIKANNIFNLKIVAQVDQYKNYLKIGVIKSEPILKDILNVGINTITKEEKEYITDKYIKFTLESHTNYTIAIKIIVGIVLILTSILIWNYLLRLRVRKEVSKNIEQTKIIFQKTKQAELGSIVANIAHQWRDSLAKVGYINTKLKVYRFQNKFIDNDLMDKSLNDIEESILFMSDTMQNFLDYYRPSLKKIEFNIYDSIKIALSVLDIKIKENNCKIQVVIKEDLQIKAVKNEWVQIWINLINNSINAALEKEIENPMINLILQKDEIVFEDNCGGIDESILQNLNNQNYVGLGIKMSKEILDKYNKILVIKNNAEGTNVLIKL